MHPRAGFCPADAQKGWIKQNKKGGMPPLYRAHTAFLCGRAKGGGRFSVTPLRQASLRGRGCGALPASALLFRQAVWAWGCGVPLDIRAFCSLNAFAGLRKTLRVSLSLPDKSPYPAWRILVKLCALILTRRIPRPLSSAGTIRAFFCKAHV